MCWNTVSWPYCHPVEERSGEKASAISQHFLLSVPMKRDPRFWFVQPIVILACLLYLQIQVMNQKDLKGKGSLHLLDFFPFPNFVHDAKNLLQIFRPLAQNVYGVNLWLGRPQVVGSNPSCCRSFFPNFIYILGSTLFKVPHTVFLDRI